MFVAGCDFISFDSDSGSDYCTFLQYVIAGLVEPVTNPRVVMRSIIQVLLTCLTTYKCAPMHASTLYWQRTALYIHVFRPTATITELGPGAPGEGSTAVTIDT